MHVAICLIEFRGLASVIFIADEMLKAADVKLLAHKNSGSAYISLLFSGDVSALNQAEATGKKAADKMIRFTKNNAPLSYDYGLGKNFYSVVINRPRIDIKSIFFDDMNQENVNIRGKAVGFIDTKGLVPAAAAADAMARSSNVDICGYQRMGSGELSVVVCGRIEDVIQAVNAGVIEAKKYGKVQNSSIIAKPSMEMYRMF